jgi:hypothetical protein
MGWSARTIAILSMQKLEAILQKRGPADGSNAWMVKGVHHFNETGRENADGAITGAIYRSIFCPELTPPERARKIGTFRIEPNGFISRFPTSTKADRDAAWYEAVIEFASIHPYAPETADLLKTVHADKRELTAPISSMTANW